MENITQEEIDRKQDTGSILKLFCARCNKEFYIRNWYYRQLFVRNRGRGFFCSRKCALTGRPISQETKEKISDAQTGISVPARAVLGEKHGNWKGDKVGRGQLHVWLKKNLSQPPLCEFCNIKPSRDLANITGVYNREFTNWKYLCVSCHKKYDYENGFRKHPSEETKKKISESNKVTYWSRR